MKITILTDGIYPLVIGGAQKHNWHLARSLASAGAQVELIHPGKRDGKSIRAFKDIPNLREIVVPYKFSMSPGTEIQLSDLTRYFNQLWDKVKSTESDVVYCQGLSGSTILKHKSRGEFNVPVVVNMHGMDMFQPVVDFQEDTSSVEDLRAEAVFQLETADAVVSLGGKLGNILHTHGIPDRKIWRIPVGIDNEWLKSPAVKSNESRIFTFIGGEEKRKGLDLLHHAIEILAAKEVKPSFRIIGNVSADKKLKASNVEYVGPAGSEQEIMNLLDESSFLILPSYCEGMPTVILEAMARGNAIITTDVGATSTLVDETNGMIIPVGDEHSLAEAIHHANGLPANRLRAMFQSSYTKVLEFEWSKMAKRNLEMFETLLEEENLQLVNKS